MFRVLRRYLLSVLVLVSMITLAGTLRADDLSKLDQIKSELFNNLVTASTEQEGRTAEDAIWQFWFSSSPTADVRTSLDAGMERREAYDFEAAENHLDKVVKAAPDYAEGYNQRAFVRFLRENFVAAQTDLEIALELEPKHFGAMSGLYHILRIQNRTKAAMGLLKQAVTIHPWLQERGALPRDLWPDSYRDIHDPELKI